MLDQKTVLVTGGSGGFGRTLSRIFSKAGYIVLVHYFKNKDRAESLCQEFKQIGRTAFAFGADLSCPKETTGLVEYSHRIMGRIDLLINCAGILRDIPLTRMTEKDWDNIVNVNLSGPFYSIRAVSAYMCKQGGGHIINIGSFAAKGGRSGQANYVAAKAGLIALTQTAARELAPYNVRVNVVFPGLIPTGPFVILSPEKKQRLIRQNLLGRENSVEEVGAFVMHLATMQNVSGQEFNLDSRVAL